MPGQPPSMQPHGFLESSFRRILRENPKEKRGGLTLAGVRPKHKRVFQTLKEAEIHRWRGVARPEDHMWIEIPVFKD